MKINKWKLIIVLVIVIALVGLLLKLFPTVFWKLHGIATEKLQVKSVEGETDLEYAYGQDLASEVEQKLVKKVGEDGVENQYCIFYPKELGTVSENFPLYPVVVWGNGTANTYVNYEPALKSLASYGFVVVGCDNSNMGGGRLLYEM